MEKKITEPESRVPVLAEADVAVLGGGPAGIGAAIAAADAGASVVIIERYGFLGGIPAICNMEPSSWCREAETVMPGGVQAMLEKRILERDAAFPPFYTPSTSLVYDTEMLKQVLDDLILEHGIRPIYHTLITAPYIENGIVKGVFIESKSGRQAVLAKRLVDCTGDADIAARAGCPFEQCDLGPDEKTNLMFGTLIFGASDVDTEEFMDNLKAHPELLDRPRHEFISTGFKKAKAAGYPIPPDGFQDKVILNHLTQGDATAINRVRVPVDGTDVQSLTQAEIKSRKCVLDTLELLKKFEPGFEAARLRNFATAMGVRETRRIKGAYQLTQEDIDGQRHFEDTVAVYPVCADGPGRVAVATDAWFQIPFGIMVPSGAENLLVAGRCVSATKDATHTSRGVDFAFATGQAAGAASALSIKQGKNSRAVDIKALQAELVRQGVRIG
ncbi:pyridine nucleotide-disulfide oxidoreductase [Spirochaetia bacterium]|nr:pyridine nucleotide-disulfide oxidoreductase [Spirochaetia bacterium]